VTFVVVLFPLVEALVPCVVLDRAEGVLVLTTEGLDILEILDDREWVL
jgi:hypothetical protein